MRGLLLGLEGNGPGTLEDGWDGELGSVDNKRERVRVRSRERRGGSCNMVRQVMNGYQFEY